MIRGYGSVPAGISAPQAGAQPERWSRCRRDRSEKTFDAARLAVKAERLEASASQGDAEECRAPASADKTLNPRVGEVVGTTWTAPLKRAAKFSRRGDVGAHAYLVHVRTCPCHLRPRCEKRRETEVVGEAVQCA